MTRVTIHAIAALFVMASAAAAGAADDASRARSDRDHGLDLGATGETIFEHTRASLRDPHFGMRVYCGAQIPGTLHKVNAGTSDAVAAMPDGNHFFWDVAFGESMPLFTLWNVNKARSRYARGLQVNFDAAAFMLLDFSSQSWGVIDTDFRIGGSLDLRPPWDGWDHLSLSVAFFHESSHLGDEYVLSAATIQTMAPPMANAALYYRANPSYQSLPVTLSADVPFTDRLTARAYAGASAYLGTDLPNGRFPSEARAGAELRWTMVAEDREQIVAPANAADTAPPGALKRAIQNLAQRSAGTHDDEQVKSRAQGGRKRRGPFAVELAYELWLKRRYRHDGPDGPGVRADFLADDGYWPIQHAVLMGLYNLDTAHSSSNAVGLSLDWMRGRSPFGQLVEYATVNAIAGGIQYYW
ncbi:MAG TPA: DUF1207 domain-containing protein [Polyangia bacterium]|nr:DUF1207 domain-containing protein [Polyangia bacterium]